MSVLVKRDLTILQMKFTLLEKLVKRLVYCCANHDRFLLSLILLLFLSRTYINVNCTHIIVSKKEPERVVRDTISDKGTNTNDDVYSLPCFPRRYIILRSGHILHIFLYISYQNACEIIRSLKKYYSVSI